MTAKMTAKDDQLKYLVQEYHDGLLLYEISNRLVWEKAARMKRLWLLISPSTRRIMHG